MARHPIPKAIFDTLERIETQQLPKHISFAPASKDFSVIKDFLLQYKGSKPTFECYRRELERLAQWNWLVKKQSILKNKRADIEKYIEFCMHPPKSWIGTKRVARFQNKDGKRIANSVWRPFVATLTKAEIKHGSEPNIEEFQQSQSAIGAIFTGLSSFYNHLLCENIAKANPVAQIRQKGKYIRQQQGKRKVRRLTELQWDFVIETAEEMAKNNPGRHERTLFIMSALYLMYLRVSELVAKERWQPQMGHFYQDSQENWWFKTVSKGNKERDISVCNAMLKALKRYRKSLNLSPALPLPNDETALVHKQLGSGPVRSDRQIRLCVQECFNKAIERLQKEEFADEARSLESATVHWLRHTGISDDINKRGRPVAHVRDDAGHSSSAITDRYNDIELQARHSSARNKSLKSYKDARESTKDKD